MTTTLEKRERIACIDRMRGLAVFTMVFFQMMERFESLGFLSRLGEHSLDRGIPLMPGLVLADIGAPAFFFVIAMNYIPSLRSRIEREGRRAAYGHFILRYLAILGFGCCIRTIEMVFDGRSSAMTTICLIGTVIALIAGLATLLPKIQIGTKRLDVVSKHVLRYTLAMLGLINLLISTWNLYNLFWLGTNSDYWGVLQAIGGAGLLMLLFAEASTTVRAFASAVIFGIFTFIHQLPGGFMEKIDEEVQGGVIGILSWCSMLLIFTVMGDLYYHDRAQKQQGKRGIAANTYLIALAILIPLGIFGYTTFAINKGSISPGYVLVNLPIIALIFWLISLTDRWQPKSHFLLWWGSSPIIMYLLQYVFHDVILSLINGIRDISFVPALAYVLVSNAIITWIAYLLYKNKRMVKV